MSHEIAVLSEPIFDVAGIAGLILASGFADAFASALMLVQPQPTAAARLLSGSRRTIRRFTSLAALAMICLAAAWLGLLLAAIDGPVGLLEAALIITALVMLVRLATPFLRRPAIRFWAIFGLRPAQPDPVLSAHDELRDQVEMLHREGSVVKADRDRLGGVLDLGELEVSDVMIHRTAMRAINADDPPGTCVRAVLDSPYTRMPVWRGSTDNIIGVVHAKDLLRQLAEPGVEVDTIDIVKLAQKPWFVPDTTNLKDQLNAFLRRKNHFAVVVDEYGEVQGIVTLEDILEEIVGDIADEHDITIQGVRPEADGSIVVDGSVPIRDLNRALDWDLPDEEATTIAGLVIHESRSIPEERQAFTFHNKRFIVMKRVKNRITRLRIRPVDPANPAAE